MNLTAMRMFLSEDNIQRHLDYLNTLKLRFSILEKSFPLLFQADFSAIYRLKIDKQIKNEAIDLLKNIRSHELFFDSFSETHKRNEKIKEQFISRDSLLYEIEKVAKDTEIGFVYIFINKTGKIDISHSNDSAFVIFKPILAVDVSEHSYFLDYGYKKDKYLRGALSYLDTEKIK